MQTPSRLLKLIAHLNAGVRESTTCRGSPSVVFRYIFGGHGATTLEGQIPTPAQFYIIVDFLFPFFCHWSLPRAERARQERELRRQYNLEISI